MKSFMLEGLPLGLRFPMASGSWQLRPHTPSPALPLQISGYEPG